MIRRVCAGLAAVLVTLAYPLGSAPSASGAALSGFTVGGTASYEANGAGVILPVTVTCELGAKITFFMLNMAQRVPHSSLVNHATGEPPAPPCSGGTQRIYILFSSDT